MKKTVLIAVGVAMVSMGAARAGYFDVINTDDPVGWWRFEDESTANGETADNSGTTGNTNDGTFNGGVTATGSLAGLGNAASFDGDSTYVDVGFALRDALDGAAAVSVEAWIKNDQLPEDDPNNPSYFVFANAVNASQTGVRLAINPTSTEMNLGGRAKGGEAFVSSGASYSDSDTWHHVVGVMDYADDRIDVYVDGVLTSNSAAFGSTSYTKGNTDDDRDSIGAFRENERFFDGLIDEVAVYNYDLGDPDGDGDSSDSRVLAHFLAIPEPTALALLGAALMPLLVHRRR